MKLLQQIYHYMNPEIKVPKCISCGGVMAFYNLKRLYGGDFCSHICSNKATASNPETRKKAIKTNLERYGVENPAHRPEVIEKRMYSNLEKYGSITGRLNTPDVKVKASINTNTPEARAKRLATIQERYGVDYISRTETYRALRVEKAEAYYLTLHPDIKSSVRKGVDVYLEFYSCDHIEHTYYSKFIWRIKNYPEITPCSVCNADILSRRSFKENELFNWVKTICPDAIPNSRSIISPYEIDIVCPAQKICIEFNGLFWHSEIGGGKDKNYHLNKTKLLAEQGYQLIHIFEDEWDHKKEIVKERLSQKLGVYSSMIYARTLDFREIKPSQSKALLDRHHIQGNGKTYRAFGLFREDELVSVLTFSKPSIAKGGKGLAGLEISRFASSVGVVGGFSKLFKNAMKVMSDVDTVFTYSDLRWGSGNVYGLSGFTRVKDSPPNYWYIDTHEISRKHRYAFRKNKDDDPILTEWENRQLQGLDRIWDCGNAKWVWVRNS